MKPRSGYSFIEAIVAIAILASVTIVALNILRNSADAENINRDFLISDMLSSEGAEMIMSIYKKNLTKFGKEYAAQCGFMLPSFTGEADECAASSTKLLDGTKYVVTNSINSQTINITPITGNFKVGEEFNQAFRIFEQEINADSDYSIYTQGSSTEMSGFNPSKFYRMVEVSQNLTVPTDANAEIKVTMGWIRVGNRPTVRENITNIYYNE
jgi:hypothetical protein